MRPRYERPFLNVSSEAPRSPTPTPFLPVGPLFCSLTSSTQRSRGPGAFGPPAGVQATFPSAGAWWLVRTSRGGRVARDRPPRVPAGPRAYKPLSGRRQLPARVEPEVRDCWRRPRRKKERGCRGARGGLEVR